MAAGRTIAATTSSAAIMAAASSAATTATVIRRPAAIKAGQNGHQGRPSPGPPAGRYGGEPSGIGNVTFLQRSGEPRRNAGHRAPR